MKKILLIISVFIAGISLFGLDIFEYVPLRADITTYTQTEFSVASKFGKIYRTPVTKTIHNFNNLGKEVEITELTPKDALISKIVSKYNASGNISEQTYYNNKQELISKTTYSYNGSLKQETNEYNQKNELTQKIIYGYTNGKLTEETGYGKDGAILWKSIYKYDDKNK